MFLFSSICLSRAMFFSMCLLYTQFFKSQHCYLSIPFFSLGAALNMIRVCGLAFFFFWGGGGGGG
jgi:hypothetical protein